MDVHCTSCGEPWDTHHLTHDAVHETNLTKPEISDWKRLPSASRLLFAYREAFKAAGYVFGKTLLNVVHCPSCPPGATPDPATAQIKAELEDILGDDLDGLASDFEHLNL